MGTFLAPKTFIILTLSELDDLIGRLTDDQLAAAIRLITFQARSGQPVPHDTAHIRVGMTRNRFKKLEPALCQVFDTANNAWSYTPLAHRISCHRQYLEGKRAAARKGWGKRRHGSKKVPAETGRALSEETMRAIGRAQPNSAPVSNSTPLSPPESASAPKTMAASTNSVQAGTPSATASKANRKKKEDAPTLFALPETEKPSTPTSLSDAPSLMGDIYKLGIIMLTRSGKSESSARACIARLLKDYDAGYVAAAINDAWQKGEQIVDPFSWIRKLLQKYPTKSEERQVRANPKAKHIPSAKPRKNLPIATPEFLGISKTMAEQIKRNSAPKRTFQYTDVQTS